MDSKAQSRQHINDCLKEIDRPTLSADLSLKLQMYFADNPPAIIGGFYPFDDEPLWMCELKGLDDRLAFCSWTAEGKIEYRMAFINDLIKTEYAGRVAYEPPQDHKVVTPNLLLVPGRAFSRNGDRLGRGKGYYDRYLEGFSGIKVGICYECQILDSIPTNENDEKVDLIITEENIYNTERK